jgi:hydrophobic/amphiphilic exporter-1 (mainly G- bacteria), HAE1 family
MSMVDLCVRRPVFATMLIVALVVLGLASYRDLGLDSSRRSTSRP